MVKICNLYTDFVDFATMDLPPRDQRHQYLRFEGLHYIDADIADFEMWLGKIYRREVDRVQVFDFGGLTDLMAEGLSGRIFGEVVVDLDTARALQFQLGGVRHRMSWRQFIFSLGLHTTKEIETTGFGLYWAESGRQLSDKGYLSADWREISFEGDFLGSPPFYTLIRDPMLRLCHKLIALLALLGGVLEVVHFGGGKQGAMISGGQFVTRLAEHFGLLTKERL
ncbi:hypothetical protein Tco_0408679 [Tanacetum coccineum]